MRSIVGAVGLAETATDTVGGASRRQRRREARVPEGVDLQVGDERLVGSVRGRERVGLEDIVEDPKTGAHGGLVVSKHIPGKAHTWIEVVIRRVRHVGTGNIGVAGSKGRADQVVEVVAGLDRVGFPFVAEPEIDSQSAIHLPVVLNVRFERDAAFVAVRIGAAVRSSLEQKRIALQEIQHRGEQIPPVPKRIGINIVLLTTFPQAELNVVAAMNPIQVLAVGEFVLEIVERIDKGRPQGKRCRPARRHWRLPWRG